MVLLLQTLNLCTCLVKPGNKTCDARVVTNDLSAHFRVAHLASNVNPCAVGFPVLPDLGQRQLLRANTLVLGALTLFGVILLELILEHDVTVCTSELSVFKHSELLKVWFVGFEFVAMTAWALLVL